MLTIESTPRTPRTLATPLMVVTLTRRLTTPPRCVFRIAATRFAARTDVVAAAACVPMQVQSVWLGSAQRRVIRLRTATTPTSVARQRVLVAVVSTP